MGTRWPRGFGGTYALRGLQLYSLGTNTMTPAIETLLREGAFNVRE